MVPVSSFFLPLFPSHFPILIFHDLPFPKAIFLVSSFGGLPHYNFQYISHRNINSVLRPHEPAGRNFLFPKMKPPQLSGLYVENRSWHFRNTRCNDIIIIEGAFTGRTQVQPHGNHYLLVCYEGNTFILSFLIQGMTLLGLQCAHNRCFYSRTQELQNEWTSGHDTRYKQHTTPRNATSGSYFSILSHEYGRHSKLQLTQCGPKVLGLIFLEIEDI